jgi:thymidine phosphorylase
MEGSFQRLRVTCAGIDTYQQPVVFMHRDCPVCRSEGFSALSRVSIRYDGREVVAVLNVVTGDRFGVDVAALSDAAWLGLQPVENALVEIRHAEAPASASALRAKVFGRRLSHVEFLALMRDTVESRLSDIEIAAFVAACAGKRLDVAESIDLTRAMIEVGERVDWGGGPVLDKHGVGGLPGNRTTPIVVAIVAAAGHRIPKTSSRAITSPAGTADTMEVMAPVTLDLAAMRRVVEREGGCIVWGGGKVRLSPADDILIRIERPLELDSEGQLVASVLSKKIAAGATHLIIDMPIGATAKVRSQADAAAIQARFSQVANAFGLHVVVLRTDGRQPVGFGIGPALEARDLLRVLSGHPCAPADLRERAIDIAGHLLEMAPGSVSGQGRSVALDLLDSGAALRKFLAICEAQGGFREPVKAAFVRSVEAPRRGTILGIDNRRLARVAKLAGAPLSRSAGLECRHRLGDIVDKGAPLFDIHAQTPGELDYALRFADVSPDIFVIGDPP